MRSVFARLRIDYTKTLLKFTQSIKLTVPVAREAIDQEFWERFAKHDKALYYLFHLFRDRTLQECLLVDPALMRQDALDQLEMSNNNNGNNPVNAAAGGNANGNNSAGNNAMLPAGMLVPLGGRIAGFDAAANGSNNNSSSNNSSSGNNTGNGNKRDREAAGLAVNLLGEEDDAAALELLESSALSLAAAGQGATANNNNGNNANAVMMQAGKCVLPLLELHNNGINGRDVFLFDFYFFCL